MARPPPRGAGLGRTFAIALVVLAWVAGTDIAIAFCTGPQVGETPAEVARGETLTVAGTGFGSDCYDTGPPPPGEGFLGIPLDIDIDITFEQGDTRVLVARALRLPEYSIQVATSMRRNREVPAAAGGRRASTRRLRDSSESAPRSDSHNSLSGGSRAFQITLSAIGTR